MSDERDLIVSPYAINRGPFNALVDDDGSGTTGSVWNKSAIQSVILDPVDAAIAAATTPGTQGFWIPVAFDAANFWSDVTGGMILVNRYMVIGKTMWWMMQVYNATVPNPLSPYLTFKVPGGYTAQYAFSPISFATDVAPVPGHLFMLDGSTLAASKVDASNWSAYPIAVYFTAVLALV